MPEIIPNLTKRNAYMSNKGLSDEFCYVIERKK